MTGHTAPLGILLAGHRAGGIILPCGAMSTSDKLIKTGVRTLFTMTSRAAAERKARRVAGRYLSLADGLSPEEGKRAVRVGSVGPFEDGLAAVEEVYLGPLMETEDAHEGLAAFMEKREPQWKGK